jgi:hypothetical protein
MLQSNVGGLNVNICQLGNQCTQTEQDLSSL